MNITGLERLQLQLDSDPQRMAEAGHACIPLGQVTGQELLSFAIGFKHFDATIIGNFDEGVMSGGPNYRTMVELSQVSYSHSYRWGHDTEREESVSSVRMPADTPVWLHPRLEGDNMHIFTNTKEKHMARSSAVDVDGKTQSISVEPSITTIGGAYVAFNPGAHAAWLDQPQTVELVRNLAQAMGGTLESQATEYDPWYEDMVESSVSGFGDEEIGIRTSAAISQDELLAHILAFSALWLERQGRQVKEEAGERELYRKVDEFRRALKPNAKSFLPTAEMTEQNRQFQIDRYHRVTGAVVDMLDQEKGEPTS